MEVLILGSAAGGGVPQWNCGCRHCTSAREGGEVEPRTQDSVAVSANGEDWILLNASPDVLQQLGKHSRLWPCTQDPRRRRSPVCGVVLTDGELDHCLGLLSLREWSPLHIYATGQVLSDLMERNVLFRTLQREREQLHKTALPLDQFTPLSQPSGAPSGLDLRAFTVHGKVPRHLKGLSEACPETTIGVLVRDRQSGTTLAYIPACTTLATVDTQLEGVDCLLFDGTFWGDDEPTSVGIQSSARGMAHVPILGGSLGWKTPGVRQRYYTHINNTNPILRPSSAERSLAQEAGWHVARDGLHIRL